MAEYIERDATVKLLRSLGSRDYRREKGTIQEAIKMVSFSEYTPAADVAEVRHGRWGVDGVYVVCSVCNRFTLSPIVKQLPTFKYCPNCGAKMDGCDGNIAMV